MGSFEHEGGSFAARCRGNRCRRGVEPPISRRLRSTSAASPGSRRASGMPRSATCAEGSGSGYARRVGSVTDPRLDGIPGSSSQRPYIDAAPSVVHLAREGCRQGGLPIARFIPRATSPRAPSVHGFPRVTSWSCSRPATNLPTLTSKPPGNGGTFLGDSTRAPNRRRHAATAASSPSARISPTVSISIPAARPVRIRTDVGRRISLPSGARTTARPRYRTPEVSRLPVSVTQPTHTDQQTAPTPQLMRRRTLLDRHRTATPSAALAANDHDDRSRWSARGPLAAIAPAKSGKCPLASSGARDDGTVAPDGAP